MRPFIWRKNSGATRRASEGVEQKPLEMTPKMGFLGQFWPILYSRILTVKYLMHFITIYYWWKFETNKTIFRGVMSIKPPRSSLKQYFFAAKRIFQISKLQNYMSLVNETWSSYVPPRHLPLARKWGGQFRGERGGSGGCIQKAIKKCHEINIISLFNIT